MEGIITARQVIPPTPIVHLLLSYLLTPPAPRIISIPGFSSDGIFYRAFAIAWSPGVKVSGTATDSSVTMAGGNTSVSSDNTWEINITTGTLKGAAGDDLTGDIAVTGLPAGLTWTARNNGANKILITVAGPAAPAVGSRTTSSVVVKGSAVSDSGATDSDAVSLYVHPRQT